MKKPANFKVVITVSLLLMILSISTSLVNFYITLQSTQNDLKTRSLPLTVDNIYTDIQSHIIEPNLVASMMAHDTFVKDWLINQEEDREQITRYLEMVANKYGMFVAFLVSEKTQSYYSQNGFLEYLNPENPDNRWYYRFKSIQGNNEINLDFNDNLDNSMIMFINHKIFDQHYHLIGATGVGLKISYINDMLRKFRQNYNFNVMFVDEKGNVVLAEQEGVRIKNLSDSEPFKVLKDQIIVKDSKLLEYEKEGESYLIKTKYIPELNLYLLVEAKLADFTQEVHRTFYFNLAISLLITVMVTLIILFTIREYNKKLEYSAKNDSLTGLMNRAAFNNEFKNHMLLSQRNTLPLSLMFFDIDDFKKINDTQGHLVGDEVLIHIGRILKKRLRQTDLVGRWGGEEFIVALIDTPIDSAQAIAQELRKAIQDDFQLKEIAGAGVTASFGISALQHEDTADMILSRVDKAMYLSKGDGKNRVSVL